MSSENENYKIKLASRKDPHIARKMWHVLGVGFILWLYVTLPPRVGLGVMSMATAAVVTCDYLRLRFPFFQKFVLIVMKPFMREEEKKRLTGLSYMLLGFWTLMFFFPSDVVKLSILFVMFGDPIASWFGSKYGKDKIGDKSLQGFLACFAVCTFIAFIFLYRAGFRPERILFATLLAGLSGGIAELIQIKKIDDNLSMPLFSAILLNALFIMST